MMSINKNNYESYLVDYSEGKLSAQEMHEVESFLSDNPAIKEEFELFIESEIQSDEVLFSGKDQLKSIPFEKTLAKSDFFQEQCIAKIENQLSEIEVTKFEKSLANDPEKNKEYQLFSKTMLNIEQINYNEKLTLKHDYTSHVINPNNFSEYCVACCEGWLNHEGMLALNAYIAANPEYKKEYDLYREINFSPDNSIVYPYKTKLKKFQILNFANAKNFSIAASVAAVLTLGYFVVKTPELINQVQTASTIQVKTYNVQDNKNTKNIETEQIITSTKTINSNKIAQIKNVFNLDKNNEIISRNSNLQLKVIKPKTINFIECEKCTTINSNELAALEARTAKFNNSAKLNENLDNESIITPKTLANNLLKSGVAKIDEITNGKVNISKDDNNNGTRFEITTKYLAFSTNINSKRKN